MSALVRGRRAAALAAFCALLLVTAAPAPAQIVLQGLAGERLDEAELSRGVVVLVVWASWAPRGRDLVERVNALHAGWGTRARVITVNFQEERGAVEAFLVGKRLEVPVFLDSGNAELSKKFNVTRVPWLIVLQDGSKSYSGNLPDDPDAVLRGILGG